MNSLLKSNAYALGLLLCLNITPAIADKKESLKPKHAAIASAHPLATQAGLDILAKGGNAFDAAVAVSAALAVVEPQSSGLGGGGFWLLHRESDQFQVVVDGREVAPAAATRNMYLDEAGNPIKDLSRVGALAAGIPGQPAALTHISEKYGNLSLAENLSPAIKLAKHGFKIDARLAQGSQAKRDMLLNVSGDASSIFLTHRGAPLKQGNLLQQLDLANTLAAIAEHGRAGFYEGTVANHLVNGVNLKQTWWTLEDLKNYSIIERKPLVVPFDTRDMHQLVTAPLPSSCGLTLSNAQNILHAFRRAHALPIYASLPGKSLHTHLLTEAWRRAYHNRSQYLGDPAFLPDLHGGAKSTHLMMNEWFALGQSQSIRLDQSTPSTSLAELPIHLINRGDDTTHFSILDANGNRVAATLSINFWFGSGLMPKGTGVVLNNEMDDFSIKPGTANGFGLVGGQANEIAPGKRPLSSMCPSFFERRAENGNQHIAILGTPGGSRIITMMHLAWGNLDTFFNPERMLVRPRYHHQFLPDEIIYEPGAFTETEIKQLKAMGHTLKESSRQYGNMQIVVWDQEKNIVKAVSDPRGQGEARVY